MKTFQVRNEPLLTELVVEGIRAGAKLVHLESCRCDIPMFCNFGQFFRWFMNPDRGHELQDSSCVIFLWLNLVLRSSTLIEAIREDRNQSIKLKERLDFDMKPWLKYGFIAGYVHRILVREYLKKFASKMTLIIEECDKSAFTRMVSLIDNAIKRSVPVCVLLEILEQENLPRGLLQPLAERLAAVTDDEIKAQNKRGCG